MKQMLILLFYIEKADPYGLFITVFSMFIVFLALFLIYQFIFHFSKRFNKFSQKKQLIKEGKLDEAEKIEKTQSGEIIAAISICLYLYKNRIHDLESFKLTINKVSRNYSPWSSKIYQLRNFPKQYWQKR